MYVKYAGCERESVEFSWLRAQSSEGIHANTVMNNRIL
jgi:hypothetical protein